MSTSSRPSSWKQLEQHADAMKHSQLTELFNNDSQRAENLSIETCAMLMDFSKTHIDSTTLTLFESLAKDIDLEGWKTKLLTGDIVNPTEQRPALHTAMRAANPISTSVTGDIVAERVKQEREECYAFAEAVRNGAITAPNGKPYQHIIHLGIGGSALGPDMMLKALSLSIDVTHDVHIVANVDGHALIPAIKACNAHETLVIVTSKTFTTTETLTNAQSILAWLADEGVENPMDQLVGVTAAPSKAEQFGIAADRIFTFGEWVGGRYSIWSSVSLVCMIALGTDAFDQFLAGAREMDEHFMSAPTLENAPVMAAFLDVYYSTFRDAQSRGMFAYDNRMGTLVSYLQQLEMESNGKDKTKQGEAVDWNTAPILWGGVGTDGQHAVFQLLHQGTIEVPVEFIAVKKASHDLDNHHKCLLANCFAQSAALMRGRSNDEADSELPNHISGEQRQLLASTKSFSGNRPSTTLLIDELTPKSLGAMVAFYENRTFIAGTLWQINVFDQMGVELGKQLAHQFQAVIAEGQELSDDLDSSTKRLLNLVL